jgi:hypothetical protein
MDTEALLASSLRLPPDERLALMDGIAHSLDEPDAALNRVWPEEAERRLSA